jgi:hypothetical protein
MRPLLAIALLVAPLAAQAADPPGPQPKAALPEDVQRMIWLSQVQIIQIGVRHVEAPRPPPGDCVVTGVVEAVWQGDAYRPGDDVTLKVPCNAAPRLGRGDRYDGKSDGIDPRVVIRSTRACVHIRRSGELFWGSGYRRQGPCDSTSGYTPLDPPPLRVRPSRPA